MSMTIANGRMIIEKSGITRFDTNEKMLHGAQASFPISGSRSFPNFTGGGGGATNNVTTTYNLGAVTSGHTQLLGAARFSVTGADFGHPSNRWHIIFGGEIVWVMDGELGASDTAGDNFGLYQYMGYSFRISGGQAQLVRRAFISNMQAFYTIVAHTITYKLRSGNWT